ncbi:hypothetical protein [Citricoccus sp. GCM10030269]|uniref:hypothetical protein n=1 Tax=Citricoccus sp. GCM10030269 TaxID=3273388 RepID=UPI003607E79E
MSPWSRSGAAFAAIGLAVATASCGADSQPVPAATASTSGAPHQSATVVADQPWRTAEGDVLVSCLSTPAFPVSTVAEGGLDVGPDTSQEITLALADLQEKAGAETPEPLQKASADEVEWAVLWQDDAAAPTRVELLLASPGSDEFSLASDWILTLSRHDGRLQATGWADSCQPRPALAPDRSWVRVGVPEQAPDPESTTVEVVVSEQQCASARDPDPHLAAEPVVVETDDDVTVYWTSESVTGGAACPGNPWVKRTLTLDEPLGTRTLLDGSAWPARPMESPAGVSG